MRSLARNGRDIWVADAARSDEDIVVVVVVVADVELAWSL